MEVRTRMAPSPTGEFHIGGMRTLLYNFALAKKEKGSFILRIEDTDRKRLVPGALERLVQVIKDYGLSWDEGPFIQSERLQIYQEHAQKLIDSGHAYYCFCSSERLEELRNEQKKQGLPVTKYDKLCLGLSQEEIKQNLAEKKPSVVRFKMPQNTDVSFDDLFLGKISINTKDLDDYVLLKSDGFPTYHLGVVVDDHIMKISHVLRGVEWLPSTPKHVLLYNAFGWEMPVHGHLPNLKEVGETKKLSKRSGTVDVASFLIEGFLPEALLNFLMFLGWNPGGEKELYSLEEFIQDFSLERVHKTDLVAFDRDKLAWFNGMYIRNLSNHELLERLKAWAEKHEINLNGSEKPDVYLVKVLELIKDRLGTLADFNELSGYFFVKPIVDHQLLNSFLKNDNKVKQVLKAFAEVFSQIDERNWETKTLDEVGHAVISKIGITPKEGFMTLRVCLTGSTATPPLFDVINLLGKAEVLKRLEDVYN